MSSPTGLEVRRPARRSRIGYFDDLDFRVGQAVQLVYQLVNLAIRGVDLALENGLILRRLGGAEFFSFLFVPVFSDLWNKNHAQHLTTSTKVRTSPVAEWSYNKTPTRSRENSMTRAADTSAISTKIALNVRPLRFAYFILDEDREAFERVVRNICTQWGGIRNFIIPVPRDMQLWPIAEQFLEIHPPDRFVSYLPDDVELTALTNRLRLLFPGVAVQLLKGTHWEKHDHSAHALSVLPFDIPLSPETDLSPVETEKQSLVTHLLPEGGDDNLYLLTIFGACYPDPEDTYKKVFNLQPTLIAPQDANIWRLQYERAPFSSVLNLTGYNVTAREISNSMNDLVFHVVVTESVFDLFLYWNYRGLREATELSMMRQKTRRTFLLPAHWLTNPHVIEGLCRFIRSVPAVPSVSSELDLIVTCVDDKTREIVRQQLAALPSVEVVESANMGMSWWSGKSERVPREADPNRVLKCIFARPPLCLSYTEGSGRPQLPEKMSFGSGKNEVRLEPPEGFRNQWRGSTAIDVICDAWKKYPRDPSVADLIRQSAWFSRYGLSVETATPEQPQYLEVNLPPVWEATRLYFSGRGYEVRVSTPGQYANALLGLIGGLNAAGVFASTLTYRLLDALAVKSSKKVAQRITKELKLGGAAEEDLIRVLRDADIVPELKKVPKRLQDLLGLGDRRKLLDLLGQLAEKRVVMRGFHATCSECQTPAWFPLHSIHEYLKCPGCSAEFLLPVEYPPGSASELAWEYTLNSLVNRVMDQDVLPAVLALHHETKPLNNLFFVPGLELTPKGKRDAEGEFDYFFIRDQELFAGECKAGTELSEKDMRTGQMAADLGVKEFSFCTVRKFSQDALGLVRKLQSELGQQSKSMVVKILSGEDLVGGILP